MAEIQTVPSPFGTERSPKGAQPTPPPWHVDADRIPGLDVTTDPRWARSAFSRSFTPRRKNSGFSTRFPDGYRTRQPISNDYIQSGRDAQFAHRTRRDIVLRDLVADLINVRQSPATTSKETKDLGPLFESETVLGTALIERTAVNWMNAKLATHRRKVLQIVIEANQAPALSVMQPVTLWTA